MNTFLIISLDPELRNQWISNFVKDKSLDLLDVTTWETEGSFGIEDIRNFQKIIVLKPFRGKEKLAVISKAETLTIEAQNALLKTLEEPPDNTYLVLSADSDTHFLPTVLSRVSKVDLRKRIQFTQAELQETAEVLEQIRQYALGDKLKLAEKLAGEKQHALLWIEKAIHITRQKLLEDTASQKITQIEDLQETYMLCKTTNVNTRLALENLFLKL